MNNFYKSKMNSAKLKSGILQCCVFNKKLYISKTIILGNKYLLGSK